MSAITSFIKNHPILAYFILTFAISWACVFVILGPAGIPLASEVSENILLFVYIAMLLGPTISGLLFTGFISGKTGFRELLSRLLRWRVGVGWYALALLATPSMMMVVLLVLSLISSELLPTIFTSSDRTTLIVSSIVAALLVGIFEEIGWTGFAIPQLMRRYGVLSTGLIVGVAWGAWHFILFWESDSFSAALPFFLLFMRLFSWLPAYRILMVWVYGRTGSLFVAMLMHASGLIGQFILIPMTLSGTAAFYFLIAWAATLWVAVVVAVKMGHLK